MHSHAAIADAIAILMARKLLSRQKDVQKPGAAKKVCREDTRAALFGRPFPPGETLQSTAMGSLTVDLRKRSSVVS